MTFPQQANRTEHSTHTDETPVELEDAPNEQSVTGVSIMEGNEHADRRHAGNSGYVGPEEV